MMIIATRSLFLVFVSMMVTQSLSAQDKIILENGRELEGVILLNTKDRVRIKNDNGEFSIPRDTIKDIVRGSDSDNHLMTFENALRQGDFSQAFGEYQLALEQDDLTTQSLESYWIKYFENLIRVVPTRSIEIRGETNRELLELTADYSGSEIFSFYASRLFYALGNIEDSYNQLIEIDNQTLMSKEDIAFAASIFFPKLCEALHRNQYYDAAINIIERLIVIDPEYGEAQKALLSLYSSSIARKNEEFEKSLQIIRNDLYPVAPNLAENRMISTLESLKYKSTNQGEEASARKLVEQYVLSKNRDLALKYIHELTVSELERLIRLQKYSEAFEQGRKYLDYDRDGTIQKLHDTAKHYARYQNVDRENPLDLMELAIEAHDQSLHQEALEILYKVRDNPEIKDLAEDQIDIIKREQDLDVLGRAIDAFDRGEMEEVIEICNELDLDEGRRSPQLEEIRQLSNTARSEINLRAKARPYQAEAYYQEAERAYFLGETNIAWRYVQLILSDFSDTPAAQRATTLLDDLQTEDQITALEKSRYGDAAKEEVELAELPESEETEKIEDEPDPLKQEIANLLRAIEEKQP